MKYSRCYVGLHCCCASSAYIRIDENKAIRCLAGISLNNCVLCLILVYEQLEKKTMSKDHNCSKGAALLPTGHSHKS